MARCRLKGREADCLRNRCLTAPVLCVGSQSMTCGRLQQPEPLHHSCDPAVAPFPPCQMNSFALLVFLCACIQMRVEHLNLRAAQLAFIEMQHVSLLLSVGHAARLWQNPQRKEWKRLLMCPFLQMWEQHAYAPRSHWNFRRRVRNAPHTQLISNSVAKSRILFGALRDCLLFGEHHTSIVTLFQI